MEINKLSVDEIIKLMEAVSKNGITSFEVEDGDSKLSMKKNVETVQAAPVVISQAPAPVIAAVPPSAPQMMNGAADVSVAVQPAQGAVQALDIGSDKVVVSPLVGTFYSASSPEADVFVKVGDTVKKGQTLGIIEAMKLMNEIECEYDGIVEAILVENEEIIEYGQPLFRIR